jgi:polyhydroxybutyrate depolymerase
VRHRLLFLLAGFWLGACATGGAMAGPLSAGCGTDPPDRPPETFDVAGLERRAIVAVPGTYRAGRPHALVLAFHGRTSDDATARRYLGLEQAAVRPTIFVYPAGLRDASGRFTWADPHDPPGALRDFALFDAILERVAAAYCIDLGAVFVVGHSLGATFANSLACSRGRQIRAVATVAGGVYPARCTGRVAALLVHNPRDRAVPLSEGQRAMDVLLGDAREDTRPINQDLGGFACQQHEARGQPLLWCLHHEDFTRRGRFYPHQWPAEAGRAIMWFFADLDAG